jgi:sugar lactone lactonase YvrE
VDILPFAVVANVSLLEQYRIGITVAGSTGQNGTTANLLSIPYGIALDSTQTAIYITDQNNNRVQKWIINATNGTTVAGQANTTTCLSTSCLDLPTGICLDSNNNLYVVDPYHHKVVLWLNGASSGITVVGTGEKLK